MSAENYHPPLTVHVFWSREGNQALRHEVARALFEFLCRPLDGNVVVKPGVGIPVHVGGSAEYVTGLVQDAVTDLGLNQPCVVAVPLLESEAKSDPAFCRAIDALLKSGGDAGRPRVLVLPVLLDSSWSIPDDLAPCRSAARAPKARKAQRVVEEVSVGICHFLMDRANPAARRRVKIFVSHAKHDLRGTNHLAERLRDHINKTELKTFFDASDVARGRSVGQQLDDAQQEAVFLSVRTDAYSESPYCLDEVLTAKRHGVPIVSVQALSQTERRSLTYGGNAFTYVSRAGKDELATITAICLQAWLRHLHFHHAAPGIFRMRNLPPRAALSVAPAGVDRFRPEPPPARGRDAGRLSRSAAPAGGSRRAAQRLSKGAPGHADHVASRAPAAGGRARLGRSAHRALALQQSRTCRRWIRSPLRRRRPAVSQTNIWKALSCT